MVFSSCKTRLLLLLFSLQPSASFVGAFSSPVLIRREIGNLPPHSVWRPDALSSHPQATPGGSTALRASSTDSEPSFLSKINPLYLGLWSIFLTYGLFLSPGQVGDPNDLQIIQSYMDNPTAPVGINPIFLVIFNGLGVLPFVAAQLACPQGAKSGLPAAPFFGAGLAMGFGGSGIYLSFRDKPVDKKTKSEASWFTRNVLENKLASVGTIGLLGAGVLSAIMASSSSYTDFSSVVSEYMALLQTSKFVSVSSLDLVVFTIATSSLIPRDYQLRVGEDKDDGLGQKIALGSVLVPILGAALYCLWRPSLPEE